jgi:V/A-type H+-transporting ATPase subunit F
MYKIAVLGGADTVLGFKALGLETYPVSDIEGARRIFHHLTGMSQDYAIIYIEESLAEALSDEIARFRSSVSPAIIAIPGREGASGRSLAALSEAVKRAIGADIV